MLSFDARLRMSQTKEKYHADKVKAGRVSTSAGVPRPYARKNVLKAQLFSPKIVGTSVVVTPKHPFKKFGPGVYYECM